jgi:transcriptional regulator with XRE-family HTH domain
LILKELSLTQTEFASMLGITQASVSRYLSGREIDNVLALAIEHIFDVSSKWILNGHGEMFKSKSSQSSEVSPSEVQVLHLLRESPELQPVVVAFLKGSKSLKELVEAAEKLPEGQRATALKLVRALG